MPWMVFAPTPDGTIDAQDRIHITGYYAGITVASDTGKIVNGGLILGVYRA